MSALPQQTDVSIAQAAAFMASAAKELAEAVTVISRCGPMDAPDICRPCFDRLTGTATPTAIRLRDLLTERPIPDALLAEVGEALDNSGSLRRSERASAIAEALRPWLKLDDPS